MTKVEFWRIKKGLSQMELAAKAQIAQSTISNIEKIKTKPYGRTLGRLASALEVEPDQLEGDVPQR